MRTVLRPLISAAILAAFAVPALAGAASAASAATVPTRHLSANGGTLIWTRTVHNAKTCTWTSSPKVARFDGTVKCNTGRVVRRATFKANRSTGAKDYTLKLVVRGTTRTVDQLKVVEAGNTTTTTIPPGTTTPPGSSFSSTQTDQWAGYDGTFGTVASASGTWTVPSLTCAPGSTTTSSTWVGVGGLDGGVLLQAGMFDNCIGGTEEQGAFAEAYPGSTSSFDLLIRPGDTVTATIEQAASGWDATVTDVTTGQSKTGNDPTYAGGSSVEWFVEDYGYPTYPLSNFGSEQFTDVTVNGVNASPSQGSKMVQNGTVVAWPADPSSGYRINE
ncbi:MAG: G1 family glutamic endopeptidase [Acidimicrobiales bacterium]